MHKGGEAISRATALVGLLITLSVLALLILTAGPARAASDVENCFLDSINESRDAEGAAPLTWVEDIAQYTRDHSADMAASGGLVHSTSSQMAAVIPSGWTSWGENIGWESHPNLPDCTSMHNAFMESSGHRDNLMNPSFQFAATGVYIDGSGQLWTTHVFFSHPSFSVGFEGTFADDDGSVFQEEIEALVDSGITNGCAPNRFCPADAVSRGQMAAFLNRGLNLPAAGDQGFSDATGTFADDINAIAAAGITSGCEPGLYCTDYIISRGQMAAFLARALDLPTGASAGFTDIGGHPFADEINAIAAAGITLGCSTTEFCPEGLVTRGQMAAFLVRGLDL